MSRSGAHAALTDGEPDTFSDVQMWSLCPFCGFAFNYRFPCACDTDPGPPVITCDDCGAEDGAHDEHCMGGR